MKKSNTSNKSRTSITGREKTCITCSTCNTFTTFSRGQSLFELVVTIAISALVIVAIVSLTVNSIQNSNFSRNKTLAATYAQQATEWLRGQRDSNSNLFIINVGNVGVNNMCLNNLAWSIAPCSGAKITGTPFTREVVFNTTVQNLVEADVTVSWLDSQGLHEVTDATNLEDKR